ncbi:hypothetical protein [Vibrio crassostreae]|uniref:hypothetical protein n=1 Tax=Vibrio crassostreae TaxID=246167 RepID=UPI001B306E73|nr:hypothetical protein [Vibrio crassostreae]
MNKTLISLSLAALLAGCGGGDDDKKAPVITDEYIQTNAKLTQQPLFALDLRETSHFHRYELDEAFSPQKGTPHVDSERCSNHGSRLCMEGSNPDDLRDPLWQSKRDALDYDSEDVRTVRFRTANEVGDPETELLPIYIEKNSHLTPAREATIIRSIKRIEADAGQQIFQQDELGELRIRYTSFAQYSSGHYGISDNLWDGFNPYEGLSGDNTDSRNSYQKLREQDGVNGGLVISYGTNWQSHASNCDHYKANATTAPYMSDPQTYMIDEDGYFSKDNWFWINLGQANGTCNNMGGISDEIIVHEVAHVLGMIGHLDGFGIGGIWSTGSAAVLKSIYTAPTNTPYEYLTVE